MKRNNISVIGITGGVGAGKSQVLSYLKDITYVRVYELDKVAHGLQEKGQVCYEKIKDVFGDIILDKDGDIDREKLGKLVFSDLEKLRKLNEIIHPEVKSYIRDELIKLYEETKVVAIEGAILIESGYRDICDEFWYIKVDEDIRLKRLIQSRGYTKDKFENICSNQLTVNQYAKACDVIIDNSKNTDDLYRNIEERLEILLGEIG